MVFWRCGGKQFLKDVPGAGQILLVQKQVSACVCAFKPCHTLVFFIKFSWWCMTAGLASIIVI